MTDDEYYKKFPNARLVRNMVVERLTPEEVALIDMYAKDIHELRNGA